VCVNTAKHRKGVSTGVAIGQGLVRVKAFTHCHCFRVFRGIQAHPNFNCWTSIMKYTSNGSRDAINFSAIAEAHLVISARVCMQSIAISVSVCLSVCPLTYLKNNTYKFREIFCVCYLWLWLGLSLTTVQPICYVLLVLWMTLYFHIMERMGQNERRRVCIFKFVKGITDGEVAVYDSRFVQFVVNLLYKLYNKVATRYSQRRQTFPCVTWSPGRNIRVVFDSNLFGP